MMGGARPSHVYDAYLPKPPLTKRIINNYLRDPTASYWRFISADRELVKTRMKVDGKRETRATTDEGGDVDATLPMAILDVSTRPSHGFGLTAHVLTDNTAMEAVLGSKLFDRKFADSLQVARVLSSAVSALNALLESGIGTSLARPLYYLLSLLASDGHTPPSPESWMPPYQDYISGEGGFVFHVESFRDSWRGTDAFQMWSASAWSATTTEVHVELSDLVLEDPVCAAVWVVAISQRRTAHAAVHIYNVPGTDEGHDGLWTANFFRALREHPTTAEVSKRYLRAAGRVLRWAQDLVAGSGSMSGAFWLTALAHGHGFTDGEQNVLLNAANTVVGSERVYGPGVNPLVLWAYQQRFVQLDPGLEPYPYFTRAGDVAKFFSVYHFAVRAGLESRFAERGLDLMFTLSPLPSDEGRHDVTLHHEQLEQSKRASLEGLLPLSGVSLGPAEQFKLESDSLVESLYNADVVPSNTLPIWLVALCSGEQQPYDLGGEVAVARRPPVSGQSRAASSDVPVSLVTEVTGRSVFVTYGPEERCAPRVYLHSGGAYVSATPVRAVDLVSEECYEPETFDDLATIYVVPKTVLFKGDLRVFVATPPDCSASMVTALTHVRIPYGEVTVSDRPMLSLGDASTMLGDAFRF